MIRHAGPVESLRRIRRALLVLAAVLVVGTAGYLLLGFSLLDALYQTVTTVATVGFREVNPLDSAGKIFTMALIAAGVGAVLYNLTVIFEAVTEGHLRNQLRRARMDRAIENANGHVVLCGFGRVGRSAAQHLLGTGTEVVAVDRDPSRFEEVPTGLLHLTGDVTVDEVLRNAGIERARGVIVALDTDTDTVYATLSARALNPDAVVVSRASTEEAKQKVELAGATRAVNPQGIGGRRMAVYALQPEVSDFLDVVMHDEGLDFRLRQFRIEPGSALSGRTVGEVDLAGRTGALLLAIRSASEQAFHPSPDVGVRLPAEAVLIVLGTQSELDAVEELARSGR